MSIVEERTLKIAVQAVMIRFFLTASEAFKEPCWFTVPGKKEMSLSVLMFLSAKQFAAMLLTAGLVLVSKINQVHCSHRVWETFIAKGDIPHYNQQNHNSNCIETTFSRIESTCFVLKPVLESAKFVLVRIAYWKECDWRINNSINDDE